MNRLIIILIMLPLMGHAQLFYNNGATVHLSSGALVEINGSAQNQNGTINVATATAADLYITGSLTNNATINGYGNIHLMGDWINNSIFNAFTGSVLLEGANQNLSGSVVTTFYNLSLSGTGIKSQTINEIVGGTLNLTDRELATNLYTMFVTNTATNAIQRTTGFVSSQNGGYLSRNTSLVASYLFPVGSSSGTLRYRPVEMTPATGAPNTYVVRMANVDAGTEGYNRSLLASGLCEVNPLFYHQINRTSGSDAIDLRVYFDDLTDGNWEALGSWHTVPSSEWYQLSGSGVTNTFPLDYATVNAWSDFSQLPYGLTRGAPVIDLGNDTTICSNTPLTLDPGAGYTAYNWNTGSGTQSISVSSTGTYSVTVTAGLCTTSDNISVTVIPSPVVDLGADTSICQGESLLLDAQNPGAAWAWSTTETTQTITVSNSNTYSVSVTNGGLCTSIDQIQVSVLPWADATITSPLAYCSGDPVINLTANDPGGLWSGSGITNASLGTFNPAMAGAGSHDIVYAISTQCGDSDTVTIVVTQSDDATITPVGTICILDAPFNLTGADPGGTWSGTGITDNSAGTFDPSVAGTGTHTITYGISGLCGDTASTSITVIGVADATITPAGPFCDNESPVGLVAADPGGLWSGTGISNASTGTFNPALAGQGQQQIVYTIAGSCGDSDTMIIEVFETPVVNIFSTNETCIGFNDGNAWVEISGGLPPYTILWNTGAQSDSLDSIAPGTYQVTVTDMNGCGWARSTDIDPSGDLCFIPHVWLPNIFSPNADGENDILFVRGDGVNTLSLVIYDRWGEKVFESTTLDLGWDGTYKGKAVDPGVFVYYLNATFVDGSQSVQSGNITVVR